MFGGGEYEYHLKMDVMDAMDLMRWHFIGLHPVCTKMTLSGNRHYSLGKVKYNERIEAVNWTVELWKKAIKKANNVYMENPIGAMNADSRLPKPQIIQPYYFGDEFQKTTCIWLYNLPVLFHAARSDLFAEKTHVSKGEMYHAPSGKTLPKWYAETSTSNNNEKNRAIRSKTFPGIAKAMANQWGNYLIDNLKDA